MSSRSRRQAARVAAAATGEKPVPQTEPLAGMIANSAGGFSFEVSDMNRLRRFICLGSEGGTYYVNEKKLTLDNAQNVLRLLQSDKAMEALQEIEQFSVEGRCAKQQALLFCYAMCARYGTVEVRRKTYEALARICRIPTHLFTFIGFCNEFGETTGWGRLHRNAIKKWYNDQDASKLAFAVTKYAQREGWSHRDVLRLAHVKPVDAAHDLVFRYAVKGLEADKPATAPTAEAPSAPSAPSASTAEPPSAEQVAKEKEQVQKINSFFQAVEAVKKDTADEGEALQLIREFRLAREHLSTGLLGSKAVWECLLENMPLTAMIRNLNKMTSLGLFDNDATLKTTVSRLQDAKELHRAKIHPFNVLVGMHTYNSGRGLKGKLQWEPNSSVSRALEAAFYASFKNVESTGKRFLLALDVSGSMSGSHVLGAEGITPRDASAALAMVTARTEPSHQFMAFSDTFMPLNITSDMSLSEVQTQISGLPFRGTDCSLPMVWALEQRKAFDVFMVFTDNETYAGKIHPSEALRKYRQNMNIAARLIVVGMTSNGFTIADPNDSGMLDMCGFDSSAPDVVREFIMGNI